MTSLAHFARYGSHRGAHSLLSHTGADEALLKRIQWLTDVPPHADAGDLQPFVSGYQLADHYVFQHTRPDLEADRAGMVYTLALIIPITRVGDIDLAAVFATLIDPSETSEPIDLEALALPSDTDMAVGPPALACVLASLMDRGCVVLGGTDPGLLLVSLWRCLSLADRERLVFGAAYHPDAISLPVDDDSLVATLVPERYLLRWSSWTVVTEENQCDDPAARAFLDRQPESAVWDLATVLLDGTPPQLRSWTYLFTASELLSGLSSCGHEDCRSLLQLLGLLAPGRRQGHGVKDQILARLFELTPEASYADIRGLRSVPWDSLPSNSRTASLDLWARSVIEDAQRSDDLGDAIAEISDADNAWPPLERALDDAVTAAPEATFRHLVALLRRDDARAVFEWLANVGLNRRALDLAVSAGVKATPRRPSWMTSVAEQYGWPLTHATSIDISQPEHAWQRHRRVRQRTAASARALGLRMPGEAVVSLALAFGEHTLVVLAGELVCETPELLDLQSAVRSGGRDVWVDAIKQGADPWSIGPADALGPQLLASLADGEDVDAVLLTAIAESPAANIADHPRRRDLWDLLPDVARTSMLAATANSIGRTLGPKDPRPEPALSAAILSSAILGSIAKDDPSQAIRLLQLLPGAKASHARTVTAHGRFSEDEARALGETISDHRWKSAARFVLDMHEVRDDLHATAKLVVSLFGVKERLARYVGIIDSPEDLATPDELSRAVVDLAATLYPEGPDEREIWERSGGEPGDIPHRSTGRAAWDASLRAIRDGGRGTPRLKKLLKTMREEHPHNQTLANLIDLLKSHDGH